MRVLRRVVQALLVVLLLVVGAVTIVVVGTQTTWFKHWLRGYIVSQADQHLNGQLSIGRLTGNLFFGIELENISLSMDGREIVAVKGLSVTYSVFHMVSQGLAIAAVRLNQPVVHLRRDGEGWTVGRLLKKQAQEADRRGPASPIAIGHIGITDGSVEIEGPVGTPSFRVPKRFDHLDARMSFSYAPVHYSIAIAHLSFRGSEPLLALNALSGNIELRDDTLFLQKLAIRTAESSVSVDGAVQQYLTKPVFNLQVSSDKVSLSEMATLVPVLAGVQLQPSFELRVSGPADHLGVDANVRSSAGQVVGSVVADTQAPGQSVAGTLSLRHVDVARFLNDPRRSSDITGDARFDVRGRSLTDLASLGGTVSVTTPRVTYAWFSADHVVADLRLDGRRVAVDGRLSAYGATATAIGRVTFPDTAAGAMMFDFRGRTRSLDLRRWPRQLSVPPAETDISAGYHAAGTPENFTVDALLDPSTVAGATIAGGSTAAFSKAGHDIGYQADATVTNLDLETIGRQFHVPALANARYKTGINGHVTANVRGTTVKDVELTASGQLVDTLWLGARIPALSFDASIAHDSLHVKAVGHFADANPAALFGRPALDGKVGGMLDADATFTRVSEGVSVDSVQASVKADLQPSTIGGLAIDRATVDGDYHHSTGEFRTLDVAGLDINVSATGTLALGESDQSSLTVHANSTNLEQLAHLMNRTLTGIATIDGEVTGNRRELRAQGHLAANNVKYGDTGALALTSDYTVTIPELSAADATVSAQTHATFVTVAGQNINELEAKTDYHQQQMAFSATAIQPQRQLQASGSLLLHPDHQEVHLGNLDLRTAGMTWQLAPGSSPAVRYGDHAVTVDHLTLVSGDQHVTADGAYGRSDDTLGIALNNVDLAAVDEFLLRPPRFTGRVNASATVTSTAGAAPDAARTPHVKADFSVAQGAFSQFHYDALGGTVAYDGAGLTMDTRLEQSPANWVEAKGYLPMAVFAARNAPGGLAMPGARPLPADRIDFHIKSSPIDVGLVQGFTSALTKVTGTLQANVDITGSATDPHPAGVVTVQDAAFTVPSTGVAYSHVKGQIDLESDRVHITQLTVLDNHQSALSVTGDLAIREGALGGVELFVTANDFKIVDNKLGNVRVRSDLQIAGELREPRISGELALETGQLNLDEIVALIGDSAYSTKQTEYARRTAEASGSSERPAGFRALTMDVHVTVPDDLVVKGQDLRTPGSPIGLGAINVTLGGDVRATKDPGGPVRLVGVVNTVRGTYDFQGRRFDILREGSVRFEGDRLTDVNPRLDIRTSRLIQGVEARVNVRGTLKQPEIALSSTPPLEQADIMSLIVFNQPINQLGEGQQASIATRAQQLAAGAVVGPLSQSIAKALNIDTFEISTAPDSGGLAQLTVGQQLGQNLYVKVQRSIGDQSQTNFVLEYDLARWLRLQTNLLQGSSTQQLFQRLQGSGLDLLFFFSY